MKKWFLLPIICFLLLVCLKPEHDNEYDPNNPNKAYLEGNVYGFDSFPVRNAKVALTYDDSNFIEQYSDNEGWYSFDRVDPGIYKIVAHGEYYKFFEYYPESLSAGASDTFDIYFYEAFWDFENEPLNTHEPLGFSAVAGAWSVIDNHDQGHVYNGITPGTGLAVAITDVVVNDFYYESMIKVDTSSGNTFVAGILFRYRDDQNFYVVIFFTDHIKLIESHLGTWTIIDTKWRGFSLNHWHTLSVDCSGDHIQVFIGNETTPLFDVHNGTFADGRVGLFAENNSSVSFDDIYIDISDWE